MSRSTFDVEAALREDGWIRGLASGLLRDGSDADDALQEARLALLRSPPPRLEDPRPWLARVALNFLRKRRREEVRRRHRERRGAQPEALRASPLEAIERVEVRRQVLEAVLALEEPYRSTLVQRYFEEMSARDADRGSRISCGNADAAAVASPARACSSGPSGHIVRTMRLALPSRLACAAGRLWNDPRRRVQVLAAVLAVVCSVLLVRGLRQSGVFREGRRNDIAAYHSAAKAVLAGDLAPAYAADPPYQYPPTLAVIVAPMGLLPYRAAAAVWVVGNLALLVLAFRWADRALGPLVQGADKVLGLLLAYRMFDSDFANGNANTLVLSILVAGFAVAGGGRPLWGGLLCGLSAGLKVYPLLLLPWMLARRRWRMASGFAIGLAAGGIVLPAFVLGPAPFARAYEKFYEGILGPMNAAGEAYSTGAPGGYEAGQSLRALLHRLLRPIDATAHDDAIAAVNLADLPKGAVDGVYVGLAAVIVAALLWAFRGRSTAWNGPEIGAALAAMALLGPLSRKAHFVVLFPAAAAGFAAVRAGWEGRRKTVWLRTSLWTAAFALTTLTAPGVVTRDVATKLLAYCPLAIASAMLIVLCAAGQRDRNGVGDPQRRMDGRLTAEEAE